MRCRGVTVAKRSGIRFGPTAVTYRKRHQWLVGLAHGIISSHNTLCGCYCIKCQRFATLLQDVKGHRRQVVPEVPRASASESCVRPSKYSNNRLTAKYRSSKRLASCIGFPQRCRHTAVARPVCSGVEVQGTINLHVWELMSTERRNPR